MWPWKTRCIHVEANVLSERSAARRTAATGMSSFASAGGSRLEVTSRVFRPSARPVRAPRRAGGGRSLGCRPCARRRRAAAHRRRSALPTSHQGPTLAATDPCPEETRCSATPWPAAARHRYCCCSAWWASPACCHRAERARRPSRRSTPSASRASRRARCARPPTPMAGSSPTIRTATTGADRTSTRKPASRPTAGCSTTGPAASRPSARRWTNRSGAATARRAGPRPPIEARPPTIRPPSTCRSKAARR